MSPRILEFFRRNDGDSFGYKARTIIHKVSLAIYPYVKVVVPNFRTAHYVYIIFMTFLMSVICYPITNFRYIDILFILSGACTQAGLNTVNLNQLRLLQQVVIYIACTLTTPIFIHSAMLFLRLYWFERHFDNIKETSKMNFKMRRNATLAARTRSFDSTQMNTVNNQGLGFRNDMGSGNNVNEKKKLPGDDTEGTSPASLSTDPKQARNATALYTELSDPEDESGVNSMENKIELTQHAIKFGDLPHPSARRKEIDPSDMYKSIAMLLHNRRDSGLDDDVLVIKPPNEIEKEHNMPIFTKKRQLLSFRTSPRRKRWKENIRTKRKQWASLKKSLSNNPSLKSFKHYPSINTMNENDSIDSEGDEVHHLHLDGKKEELSDAEGHHADDEDDDDDLDGEHDDEHDDEQVDEKVGKHGDEHDNQNIDDLEYEEDEEASIRSLYSDDSDNGVRDSDFTSQDDHHTGYVSFSSKKTKFDEPSMQRRPRHVRRRSRRGLKKWRTLNISKILSGHSDNPVEDDSDDEEDYFSASEHSLSKMMSTNYLSWEPTIGRNSTFYHMTDEQKEELGGVEYRAIKLLIKILVFYYVGFHVIAFCFFVGFIKVAKGYDTLMRELGFSPTWWGFFTAQSVFNDLGFTLTPNSMMSFSRSVYMLVVSSFFIVIGNTGFPVLLRFIIWIMFKMARPLSLYKESLGFLLDHPRRCFTLLFPSVPTWWLLFILVALNATDLVLFIILDLHSDYLSSIPAGFRVLDGLFQAFSTRTAGFSVVDLSQLHPAVQVSYMIMMYISVLPLAISIRRTNVYEEQSLGIYLHDDPEEQDDTPHNFIGTHLRNQLSFDLWFIFLGLFIICIAEGGKLQKENYRFSIFAILFEIISAYGTVGLSLGYPNVDQSFSYEFTTISKLVIIAMMVRGRHRGLPYTLDRAIMLSSDDMQRRDAVQEHHALQRAHTLDVAPTRSTYNDAASTGISGRIGGLTRTITRKAGEYRKYSLFPTPTRLPSDMHEMHTFPSHSFNPNPSGILI